MERDEDILVSQGNWWLLRCSLRRGENFERWRGGAFGSGAGA